MSCALPLQRSFMRAEKGVVWDDLCLIESLGWDDLSLQTSLTHPQLNNACLFTSRYIPETYQLIRNLTEATVPYIFICQRLTDHFQTGTTASTWYRTKCMSSLCSSASNHQIWHAYYKNRKFIHAIFIPHSVSWFSTYKHTHPHRQSIKKLLRSSQGQREEGGSCQYHKLWSVFQMANGLYWFKIKFARGCTALRHGISF